MAIVGFVLSAAPEGQSGAQGQNRAPTQEQNFPDSGRTHQRCQ
jgi:hypothetical protein